MYEALHATILRLHPQAKAVTDIQSYRADYLPFPARVTVRTAAGGVDFCVVKASAKPERLTYEAQVLRALADLQLPVPQVLGGPVTVMFAGAPLTVLLVSELAGKPLPWLGLTDLKTALRTGELLQQGVERLHALTSQMLAHPVAKIVPTITLASELQTIVARGGSWFDVPTFTTALRLVEATVPRFAGPLVFSNGDYNPLNFLATGDTLTGWVDFEHACFEDPYIGFAKFVLWADDDYGWGAGVKTGLVGRYLDRQQVAPAAFLVRLILRGLQHVQDTDPSDPPVYMMQVITEAVRRVEQVVN